MERSNSSVEHVIPQAETRRFDDWLYLGEEMKDHFERRISQLSAGVFGWQSVGPFQVAANREKKLRQSAPRKITRIINRLAVAPRLAGVYVAVRERKLDQPEFHSTENTGRRQDV